MMKNMGKTNKTRRIPALLVLAAAIFAGCAGGPAAPAADPAARPAPAPSSAAAAAPAASPAPAAVDESLDGAINEAAAYFAGQLPARAKIAITGIDAQTSLLSAYIVQELWRRFQETGVFTMIDRQNQGAIQNELLYQAGGYVADSEENPAQRIGHFPGAEFIIYGEALPFGGKHRLVLYASRPEQGTSLSYTKNILLDPQFLPEKTLDAAIERAVAELGRNLTARTRIGIMGFSYRQYETVSDFSEYLKKNLIYNAARHDKYEIVERGVHSAALGGIFYPAEDGVAVILQLVSVPDAAYIGAAKFTVPQAELDRNKVSILPPNTTQSDIERVYRTIAPYDGKNNAFGFTVKCLRPDALFYDGDTLSFQIYAEKDCYFKVTAVDVHGTQQVMYPVYSRDNNFIRGGTTRILPGDDNFVIDMREPFGVEYVLVAAYGEQFTREIEKAMQVSAQSIRNGLTPRGLNRRELPDGTVVANTSLEPQATARFSYTILPR
jgi:hypothetical protein